MIGEVTVDRNPAMINAGVVIDTDAVRRFVTDHDVPSNEPLGFMGHDANSLARSKNSAVFAGYSANEVYLFMENYGRYVICNGPDAVEASMNDDVTHELGHYVDDTTEVRRTEKLVLKALGNAARAISGLAALHALGKYGVVPTVATGVGLDILRGVPWTERLIYKHSRTEHFARRFAEANPGQTFVTIEHPEKLPVTEPKESADFTRRDRIGSWIAYMGGDRLRAKKRLYRDLKYGYLSKVVLGVDYLNGLFPAGATTDETTTVE